MAQKTLPNGLNVDTMKIKLVIFEELEEINEAYFGKMILEIKDDDKHVLEPTTLFVNSAVLRSMRKSYEDVNEGTWMGADPVGFFEAVNKNIMGYFKFYRALPVITNGERNTLITGVKGQIVIHEEKLTSPIDTIQTNVISLDRENIIIELHIIDQWTSWLMKNHEITLEEVLVEG